MYIICCYHVVLTFDVSENIIYSFDMTIDMSFYKYRLVPLFTTKDPNLLSTGDRVHTDTSTLSYKEKTS